MRSAVLLTLLAVVLTACQSGPNYCQRTVDDWQNELYVKTPITAAALTDIIPCFLILKVLAFIPDVLFLNPTQFWGVDVWRMKGAAFDHQGPSNPEPWFLQDDY